MNYQLLGRSGLRVSDLCLGTMTFGEDWGWGSPKEEAKKIYDAFREAGGNFIDTANVYTQGTSERFVGEFIAGHREEIVLATKYTNAMPGRDPNAGGNHRKNLLRALEGSLRRLDAASEPPHPFPYYMFADGHQARIHGQVDVAAQPPNHADFQRVPAPAHTEVSSTLRDRKLKGVGTIRSIGATVDPRRAI